MRDPAALSRPPDIAPDWALFLDFDGTLVDIAPRPEQVAVAPGLAPALSAVLARLGGAVAIVSGRPIGQIDALIGEPAIPAAGQHGLEWRREAGDRIVPASGARAPSARLREAVAALSAEHAGTFVEDKGLSVALHYRAAPALGPQLGAILEKFVADEGDGLVVVAGKCVFEVKQAGIDKGAAIARFLEAPPFAGRHPVMVGDDVTDEDAFRLVNARGGDSVLVGDPGRVSAARYGLPDPPAVMAWLAQAT